MFSLLFIGVCVIFFFFFFSIFLVFFLYSIFLEGLFCLDNINESYFALLFIHCIFFCCLIYDVFFFDLCMYAHNYLLKHEGR